MPDPRPMNPPRLTPWRVIRQFLPSPVGCVLWLLAAALLAGALAVAGLLALAVVDGDGEANPGVALFLLSVLAVPVVALLFLAAAATSGRSGARALLLLSTGGVLALGATSCGQGLIALDTPPGVAWTWSVASYGSGAVLATFGALALLAFTPHWVRESLETERRRFIRDAVLDRGSVDLAEPASALGVPVDQARGVVIDLVADGELDARIDDRVGRVFTVDHLSRQQHRLAGLIVDRGRERIAALAGELGEPPEVVEGWVDELILAGVVRASVDRSRELVLWAPLGDGAVGDAPSPRSCAGCGGPLRAVGGGLFRCVYCAAELEIGRS